MHKTRILIAVLALALVGCGSDPRPAPVQDPSPTTASPDDVTDVDWMLTASSVNGEPLPNPDTHPITLRFENGRMVGTSACNNYGADTVLAADGTIDVGMAMSTMMACEPREVMVAETAYHNALPGLERWALDGDELVLTGPDVELRFSPTGDGA